MMLGPSTAGGCVKLPVPVGVGVELGVTVGVLERVEVPELVLVMVPVLEDVAVAVGVWVLDGEGITVDQMKLPPAVAEPMTPARYTVPSLSSCTSSHVDVVMSAVPALVGV